MNRAFSLLIIFIIFHLALLTLSRSISIPKLGYPLEESVILYSPSFLAPLSSFDGAHYILIAQSAYGQYQQAFFPLYPLLINFLSNAFASNFLITGLAISWSALFFGIIFFKKLAETVTLGDHKSTWAILFILLFPASFFYFALYPESLFLFFSSASLYFMFKKKYLPAALFAYFASLTKIQGVLLIIPFILCTLEFKDLSIINIVFQLKAKYKKIILALSPIYGFLTYSYYLDVKFGDWLAFYHSQEAFGAERTSQGIVLLPQVVFRYIKIIVTSQITFQYWVAVLEISVFCLVLSVLVWDLYGIFKSRRKELNYLSLNLYSIAVLMLPTLTGTLSSVPRYALLSFGFFIALAKIKNIFIKITIALIFSIIHAIIFVYFIKGYFVG